MPTSDTKPILDLVASMERAKANQRTDSDQTLHKTKFALLEDLHSACDRLHATTQAEADSGAKLQTSDLCWALAQVAAFYIATFAPDNLSTLTSTVHHATLILDSVLDIRKGPQP